MSAEDKTKRKIKDDKKKQKTSSFINEKTVRIFNIASIAFILGCFLFYGGRLVYFAVKQNAPTGGGEVYYLSGELVKHESVMDLTQGLVKNEDGSYTFKGKPDNNYLYYSGRVFRIVGIDKNGNVKAIAQNCDTVMICSPSVSYEDSVIRRWLNKFSGEENTGIYYNTLNTPIQYLAPVTLCIDKTDDISNISSNEFVSDDTVTLLSLYDYKEAGGANSYLNNGENWYLATTNTKGHYWFVSNDGGIDIAAEDFSVFGIRPVISVKPDIALVSGSGTAEEPYIIEPARSISIMYDANVGSYVSYSGYTWRVSGKSSERVQLVCEQSVEISGKEYTSRFGSSQVMDPENTDSDVAYYLNHTFIESLSDRSILVEAPWYNGAYATLFGYDYRDIYNRSYTGKAGTIKIGDMYLNSVENVFTSTGAFEDAKLIFTINSAGGLFADYISNEHGLRASIYINVDTPIVSGSGTVEEPYTLGSID